MSPLLFAPPLSGVWPLTSLESCNIITIYHLTWAQYLLTNTSGMSNYQILLFFFEDLYFQKTFKRPRWQWILMSTPSTSRSPRRPGSGETGSQLWRGARTCAPPPSPTSATSTPPSWRRCLEQTPGSRMSSAASRQETLTSLVVWEFSPSNWSTQTQFSAPSRAQWVLVSVTSAQSSPRT